MLVMTDPVSKKMHLVLDENRVDKARDLLYKIQEGRADVKRAESQVQEAEARLRVHQDHLQRMVLELAEIGIKLEGLNT